MPILLLCLSWFTAQAGTLELSFLDVGQGDAVFMKSPEGKTALIDAGPVGARVAEKLQAQGVEHLNLIVATHGHADHIGGMRAVIEVLPPGLYVDQGMAHTSATYENLMSEIERSGLPYRAAKAGQSFSLGQEVLIEILHPQDALLSNTRSDLNSNSVVTRITHGEVCILLVGDAESETEETLLRKGIGHCQVLKVAHHGSSYSTSAAWLRTIDPEIAVISAGSRNRYGHPSRETLDRLQSSGAEIFRTDTQGEIVLRSDGLEIQMEARGAPPRPSTESPAHGASDALVSMDVNTASALELEALPGIGKVKAAAIVEWRETHGAFSTLSDLDAVPGIGPATLAKLEPVVVFGPEALEIP